MAKRMRGPLVGLLVLVVLLWVIMPALLYLVGWGVARYTKKAPAWIGFAALRKAKMVPVRPSTPVNTQL
jgi:hypothetical protein